MPVKTLGYLMTALTLFTPGATAQAAPKAAAVKATAPQATVIVKIGSAMQEEYTGGNPAARTTTYLTGETARKPAANKIAPKPQG